MEIGAVNKRGIQDLTLAFMIGDLTFPFAAHEMRANFVVMESPDISITGVYLPLALVFGGRSIQRHSMPRWLYRQAHRCR